MPVTPCSFLGQPSTKDFIRYVDGNMLPNFPIKKADILCAEDILGPNLVSLNGKITRTTPSKVILNALNDLPSELLELHQNGTLAEDIMYVNKVLYDYDVMCNTYQKGRKMIKQMKK